jgi:hypothetical protein
VKALLYCYRSGVVNNVLGLALAGVFTKPLTCPPLTATTFPYERLGEVDLIYIALHGAPGWEVLRGDDYIPALDVARVLSGPRLREGCTVILEGCYGARTPLPAAFYEMGAVVVIASEQQTWDRKRGLGRAGKAGSAMVRALMGGADAESVVVEGFEVV